MCKKSVVSLLLSARDPPLTIKRAGEGRSRVFFFPETAIKTAALAGTIEDGGKYGED